MIIIIKITDIKTITVHILTEGVTVATHDKISVTIMGIEIIMSQHGKHRDSQIREMKMIVNKDIESSHLGIIYRSEIHRTENRRVRTKVNKKILMKAVRTNKQQS